MVSQLYFLFLLGLSINSPPHKQRYKKMTTTAFYQEKEHLCMLILEM